MQSCTHHSTVYHTQTVDTVLTDTSIRQQVVDKTQGEDDSLNLCCEKNDLCCQLHTRLKMSTAYSVMRTMLQVSLPATLPNSRARVIVTV